MEGLRQYYDTLGVKPGASLDEIKQAYRDSVKVWHPDRFADDIRLQQKAQDKMKGINEAYKILGDYTGMKTDTVYESKYVNRSNIADGRRNFDQIDKCCNEIYIKNDSIRKDARLKPMLSWPNILFVVLFVSIITFGGAGGFWMLSLLLAIIYNCTKGEAKLAKMLYVGFTVLFIVVNIFAKLQESKESHYAATPQYIYPVASPVPPPRYEGLPEGATVAREPTQTPVTVTNQRGPAPVSKKHTPSSSPLHKTEALDPTAQHMAQILSKHPDALTLLPEVEKWIEVQPEQIRTRFNYVLDNGSAKEIINLYDVFKEATDTK